MLLTTISLGAFVHSQYQATEMLVFVLAYKEFRPKEYERARDGEWLDDIPDDNIHSIDAVRYAMMDEVLRWLRRERSSRQTEEMQGRTCPAEALSGCRSAILKLN